MALPEWVGPEPHGLGAHDTGMVKDPFTAVSRSRCSGGSTLKRAPVHNRCTERAACLGVSRPWRRLHPDDDSETVRWVALLCGPTGGSPHSDPA